MIDIEKVIYFLQKNGKSTFQQIWNGLKNEFGKQIKDSNDESKIKSDLHLSMTKDGRMIVVTNSETNKSEWNLIDNYSFKEVENIKLHSFGEYEKN